MTARPSCAKFTDNDPCFLDVDVRPDWQSHFGNGHPVKLEIGFGMGDFLIDMAVREPNSNFIGIDFSQDGIRNLLARINNLQLKNIRVVHGDVRIKIPLLFKDEELAAVFINFPDPWPRKRHFKRRLIKPELANMIAKKLAPEGRVHLATDSEPYALEILEYFNAESLLQNSNRESGFLEDRDHLPKTKYEKSFIYAGDKIHYMEYSRLADAQYAEKKRMKTASAKGETIEPKEPEGGVATNDELLIKKFMDAEAKGKDACDLKRVADNLADAGDKRWARKVYLKAEDMAQDSLDFIWLAYSISQALGDGQWAKELYRKAEGRAESAVDLNWLAYSIFETLGEKDWAIKLFKKAESKPENIRELCDLADSIFETLGDKEWGVKVYKKAEEKTAAYSDFRELADSVCAKLGPTQWTRELYKKAEGKAEDSSDFNSLAERLCDNLGDKEWAIKVCGKAENRAQDSGDFRGLAGCVCQKLSDEEWAVKLYKTAEVRAVESYEFRWLADSLFEKLGDKEWAEKLYKKAEDKAEAFYEFRWLAESLFGKLADHEWASQVYKKAEARAKDPSDFNRLALPARRRF